MLLLWPLRDNAENKWIRTFSTWIFRFLVPLLVMLFLAIFERIGEYGVTINRHLVIAMASGLAVVVLYFVLSRKKDVRIIPIVIFCVAILSAYGPLSAFSISEWSQTSRLKSELTRHDITVPYVNSAAMIPIADKDRRELSSIVEYLVEWHGGEPFKQWLPDSLITKVSDWKGDYRLRADFRSEIAQALGFEYLGGYYPDDAVWFARWFSITCDPRYAVPVGKYEYAIPMLRVGFDLLQENQTYNFEGGSVNVTLDTLLSLIVVNVREGTLLSSQLRFDLRDTILALAQKSFEPKHSMPSLYLSAESDRMAAMLVGGTIEGRSSRDSVITNSFSGMLLLKRK
jgi:hypothetical protein